MQLEPGRLFSVWPRLYVRPLRNILLRVDRLDTGSIYGFSIIWYILRPILASKDSAYPGQWGTEPLHIRLVEHTTEKNDGFFSISWVSIYDSSGYNFIVVDSDPLIKLPIFM